ncbi:MAG: TRAP transporter substrate-binding protein [Ectothiorhodospiraceae bacterium]|nr:TRAP transporter substrate-binding protein [Ectothiorhodospiraceae bacterium]
MKRLATCIAAMLLGLGATAAGADTRWDMATPYGESTFHTQNIREFVKEINEATNGELRIEVHSAGSLVSHPNIKRAVRSRQIQMGEVFISILGNESPIYAVDSVPFLATSYEEAAELWEASRPKIEQLLERDRIKLLYAVAWPAQGFYTNQELNTVEDFRGLRFRAYNATTSRMAELLGMQGTQVEVPEIPQAFSTGIINTMITSPTTGVDSTAWDFVDYFYDVQAWIPKNMVVVNQQVWDQLDESTQEIILEAAANAEERGWQMSREEADRQKAILDENGLRVIEPSEELMNGLREIGEQMIQEWLEQAGSDGEALLETYGYN